MASTALVGQPDPNDPSQDAPIALQAMDVPSRDPSRMHQALTIYAAAITKVGWMIPELQRAHTEAQRLLSGG
jgi:hypothetical protein